MGSFLVPGFCHGSSSQAFCFCFCFVVFCFFFLFLFWMPLPRWSRFGLSIGWATGVFFLEEDHFSCSWHSLVACSSLCSVETLQVFTFQKGKKNFSFLDVYWPWLCSAYVRQSCGQGFMDVASDITRSKFPAPLALPVFLSPLPKFFRTLRDESFRYLICGWVLQQCFFSTLWSVVRFCITIYCTKKLLYEVWKLH